MVVCTGSACTGVVMPSDSALPGVNLAQTSDAVIDAGVASGALLVVDNWIHSICIVQAVK